MSETDKDKTIKLSLIEKLENAPYMAIILLSLIVYFNTLFFDFVGLDDDFYSAEINPDITQQLSSVGDALSDAYLDLTFYRPVVNLTLLLDLKIGGGGPVMFHISNLLFHIITACLVFVLMTRLKYSRRLSLILALVFAVHPIFTNAVTWIVGRCDLLSGLFSVLSFIYLIDYLENRKGKLLFLHFLSFALAVFSKENAMLMPLVFGVYYITYTKGFDKRAMSLGALWFLPIALYFMIKSMLNIVATSSEFGISNILLNIRLIPEAFAKFFLPFTHVVLPNFSMFYSIAGTILLIATFFYIIRTKQKLPSFLLSFVWFLVFLIPGMLISLGQDENLFDYLECRLYLSSIGLFLLLAMVLKNKVVESSRIYLISGLFILFLGLITVLQNNNYKDPITFWKHITDNKEAFSAKEQMMPALDKIFKRGVKKAEEGDIEAAMIDFDRVISIDTSSFDYYDARGFYRMKINDLEGALSDFTNSIRINPENAPSYYQRAFIKMRSDDFIGALPDLNKVIELEPESFLSYYQRALVKYRIGDFTGSINDCTMSLKYKADFSNAMIQRGLSNIEIGNKEDACRDFNRASQFRNPQAYQMLKQFCE